MRKGQIVLVWPRGRSTGRQTLFKVTPYIKRIVATAGEKLALTGAEPADHPRWRDMYDRQQRLWRIPQGYLFVCGDNRERSIDSRTWGPLPLKSVLGVVVMKLPHRVSLADSPSHPYSAPSPTPPRGLGAGQDATAFTAQTVSDEKVTLASYAGRAVIFLFIVPSPFLEEDVLSYAALAPKAADAGVEMILVSRAEVRRTQAFLDALKIDLPVLVVPHPDNPFFQAYHIVGVPAFCLINEQDKVQLTGDANLKNEEWRKLISSSGWNSTFHITQE